jgi:alkanesulfonate monooxygenase SsuD/methylene tetrahydromethanopterin reductase-like flavin-dependent oxidoreductase (luciferase family)
VPEGSAIGDPEQVARAIEHWESIGVDGINFMVNGCELLSQTEVLDSMRLFASEVMPRFRAREA